MESFIEATLRRAEIQLQVAAMNGDFRQMVKVYSDVDAVFYNCGNVISNPIKEARRRLADLYVNNLEYYHIDLTELNED